MKEIMLIRQIRSDIANQLHYKVNGDNWSEYKYLIDVVDRIDSYLKQMDEEYEQG